MGADRAGRQTRLGISSCCWPEGRCPPLLGPRGSQSLPGSRILRTGEVTDGDDLTRRRQSGRSERNRINGPNLAPDGENTSAPAADTPWPARPPQRNPRGKPSGRRTCVLHTPRCSGHWTLRQGGGRERVRGPRGRPLCRTPRRPRGQGLTPRAGVRGRAARSSSAAGDTHRDGGAAFAPRPPRRRPPAAGCARPSGRGARMMQAAGPEPPGKSARVSILKSIVRPS